MSLDRRTARRFAQALLEECQRQRRHLRVSGYPAPYYISYLFRDIHSLRVWGCLGNINQVREHDARNVYCDVRVGSYNFDQVTEGGLDDRGEDNEVGEHVDMPVGNDTDALKYHLWRLTDARYREAIQKYLQKKSHYITYVDPNRGLPSFRRAEARKDLQFRPYPDVDLDAWKQFVVRSSRLVKRYPQVKDSWVEVNIRDITRIFVNSEGSQVIDQSRVCELSCDLWLLTAGGEGITTRVSHISPRVSELPDLAHFEREIRSRVKLLGYLAHAPTLKSYAGPVLLAPGPAGILFHEVLGHRLEGSRLLSTREGQTFARDLGRQILPRTFSVYDDPTLSLCAGVTPVGSYRYDDEGSPAQRAMLVRHGKLAGFLSGRTPLMRRRLPGNGHARNDYNERPVSRMGNLVVEASGGLSHAALRERFIEEVRRQGLPFGIMILEAQGGETATEAYDFQAFLGEVSLAAQVFPDGRQNLVRNISFVGTPLSALRNIRAIGDTPRCENAFCGAESGTIPVSTTSPAVLMANLELQASDQRKYTQFLLPMPHERPRRKKAR